MKIDELLGDALREDARGAVDPHGWDDVRERAQRRRTNRRRVRGAGALATLIALVAAAAVLVGGSDDPSPKIAAGPFTNAEVVAIVRDRLVVLSPTDGHVIRVITDDVGPTLTFGGITTTPDGQTVYFTRIRRALPCDQTEIVSVPAEGGPVAVVDDGRYPAVTPDGKTLVYAKPTGDGCGPGMAVTARSLVAPAPSNPSTVIVPLLRGAEVLAFSPSGDAVLTASIGDPQAPDPELPLILESGEADDGGHVIAPGQPTESATYLGDGRPIVSLRVDGGHRIAEVQPDGSLGRTLLVSHEAGVLHSMRVDDSGQVLLHFGGSVLQTWRLGEGAPTTIVDDLVRDATWISPSASKPPIAPVSDVVAVQGGRLVVLTPDDERVLRTLVDGIGTNQLRPIGVAATPDGASVFFTRVVDGCSTIFRVPAAGGVPTEVVTGGDPVVSPNGRWLAYVTADCRASGSTKNVLGLTDLRTGTNTRPYEQYLTDHPSKLDVVAWSPDSDRLVFEVFRDFRDGDPSGQRAFVLDALPFGRSEKPPRLGYREMIGAAAYLPNGHLLAARSDGDGYEVVEIIGGEQTRVRFREPGASPLSLSLDARGRLLVESPDRRLLVQEDVSAPRQIAEGVEGAAWLLATSQPGRPTGP